MDAIILAGYSEKNIKEFGIGKPQIELNGKKLVRVALEAVCIPEYIDRVFIIGNQAELKELESANNKIIQGSANVIKNITDCITKNGIHGSFIVLASDLPFVSDRTIRDFISDSLWLKAHLYYPIVSKKIFKERYPEYAKTFFRLKEGIFTGGSVFIADAEATVAVSEFVQDYFNNRKHPFKIAGMIGLKGLFKFLSGRLSISEVVEAVRKRTGYEAAIIISKHPQIALDLDKQSQIKLLYAIENRLQESR